MGTPIQMAAPAKINLHLGVYAGRDERGYHRADSVMIAIALHDEVSVSPAGEIAITTTPELDVPERRTVVARAARRLASAFAVESGARIEVVRLIPDKSGLGSASTDAAAAIRALCKLWGLDAADPRVVEVAQSVGADVAFFLNPAPSWFVGAGDELRETFPPLPDVPIVLARPLGGVSTPEAYAEFDLLPSAPASADAMCAALRAGSVEDVAANLFNSLEAPACRLEPEERVVVEWLRRQDGVVAAQVTGSGSCVFGICESFEDTRRIAGAALGRGWWSCATRTI